VAQGFTYKYGTDFDETFGFVVRQESLHPPIAISVQYDSILQWYLKEL